VPKGIASSAEGHRMTGLQAQRPARFPAARRSTPGRVGQGTRSGKIAPPAVAKSRDHTLRSAARARRARTLPAEYEREDYQVRGLLGIRMVANFVSGQPAEAAVTVVGHSRTDPALIMTVPARRR